MTSFYGEYREKDIISDEEENRVSRANVDKWIFRLFLILIGFMPLIVLAHTEEVISPLISNVSLLTSGTKGDLFTHYKSLIVLVITVIAGLLLLAKICFMNGQIRKTKLNFFLGAFTFAIVITTILSPNISITLNGQYNRSDGAISWLCYISLMFISINITYPKKAVNYVMYVLIPFVFINLYIISMNFMGNDLLQKAWMQQIISLFLPEGTKLSEGSQLVGTLNQWNYMSGMFAIMTILFLTWAIIEKSWVQSIIGLITSVSSIAVMFMSISTSGFLTVLLIFPLVIFSVFKVKHKIKSIIIISVFLILSSVVLHLLSSENPRVWSESFGVFLGKNLYTVEEPIATKTENFDITLSNKVYASDDNFKLPILPDREYGAGSGRLFIWEKIFELIKNRPIVGYGLDTVMYNFPHFNIDTRSAMWYDDVIVDKPHNTYVGILYGTGFIGFIPMMAILTLVVLNILMNFYKRINVKYFILGFSSLAYFVQSVFNDSLPGISAVMWIFIGMMFALIFAEKEVEESNQ
ncbi:O-antigen ligase family protein [Lysinibacillus telephonicus]|uniref:O-antigen ligase family protein n=1 Tax=Lysinibacillus telephonicus TaxID=1714840 RepID=UPI003B9FEDBA